MPDPPVVEAPPTAEFGLSAVDSVHLGTEAGHHMYLVTLTLTGVTAGDELSASLTHPQSWICPSATPCAPQDAAETATATATEGTSTLTFYARVPGNSSTSVTVTRGGGSAVTALLR